MEGAGAGKAVVSATCKVCSGRPSVLFRSVVFASLPSWSWLRQRLFLFGFSFSGLVFFLASERLQVAVLSCLEASSIGACSLLPHGVGAAPLQLAIGSQPRRGGCGVTPARTHCLACSCCLLPRERRCPSSGSGPDRVCSHHRSTPAAFLSRAWLLER